MRASQTKSWWELKRNRPTHAEKRTLCLDDFPSLTALCEDCIACNVDSEMTSWEKNSPHFSLATRLRRECSRSFNVLNYWICKPCRNSTGVKESPVGLLEPIGTSWRKKSTPWTDCGMLLMPRCSWKLLGLSYILVLLTTLCEKMARIIHANQEYLLLKMVRQVCSRSMPKSHFLEFENFARWLRYAVLWWTLHVLWKWAF